jgi:single-stranded-DNA-specific exonuclease
VHAPRFEIAECSPAAVERLRDELGVSGALAQVLVRRDLADPGRAQAFLDASEEHPPSAFAGIEAAVAELLAEIRTGGTITVHGDYDVDGVCSTAVLVRALRALGATVDHFIPDRAGDGYGLAASTVELLARRGTRLLVTVDCGITAVEEVERAHALGMRVVVTDHHRPASDGRLPRAPLVHPRLCDYPFPELCGTAVAHKLAGALVRAGTGVLAGERIALAQRSVAEDLDLVALATIADLVPLIGENRSLVRRGLRALAATPKPGLRALIAVAGLDPARVGERAVGFALAPRLNAAGRLYRADAALELLLTQDAARAAEVARELDDANRERRRVELGIRLEAEAQMEALGERAAYVLAGDGWHPGVVGIVASRLVERSGRPVIVVGIDGEAARGSGRSIEAFDLLGGLGACAQHLRRYGGHRAAAGVELSSAELPAFAAALAAHAEGALATADFVPVERVDAVVSGPELGMGLAEELQRLAPHGRGNPPVALLVEDATFADARGMGDGRHARFTVLSDGARARAVAFGRGLDLGVRPGEPARATFALEVNEWNGVTEPRLVLRHAAPAPGLLERDEEPLVPAAAAPVPRPRRRDAQPVRATVPEYEELVLFALP